MARHTRYAVQVSLAGSLAFVMAACGTHSSGMGAPSSGGSSDARSPWSQFCPESQPTVGSACDNSLVQPACEYGDAWWDVACDAVVQCTPDGAWGRATVTDAPCVPPDAGVISASGPSEGCPNPRPRLGATCSGVLYCGYGLSPNSLCEECTKGYWQAAADPCDCGCP